MVIRHTTNNQHNSAITDHTTNRYNIRELGSSRLSAAVATNAHFRLFNLLFALEDGLVESITELLKRALHRAPGLVITELNGARHVDKR